MSENHNEADGFLRAARQIRLARSTADVASALLRSVSTGSPRSSMEWRRRAAARTAAESTLRRLELSLNQRSASSPERASDLRIKTRKTLERILRPVSRLDQVDLYRFSDMAVASIASIAGAIDVLKSATEQCINETCAWLTLGGRLFAPAKAAEFAEQRGLEGNELEDLLYAAGKPLLKVCKTFEASNLGQLRVLRNHPDYDLTLIAVLDASTADAPLIRIKLQDLDAPAQAEEPSRVEPDDSRFPARLLRILVS